MRSLTDKLILNPKQVFLLDGIGALLTALMLGIVLTKLEAVFGMPKKTLYMLSALALGYAIFSLSCYFNLPQQWKPFLKGIIIANILYCCLTTALLIYFYNTLTIFGVIYFMAEIVIIISLALLEKQVYRGSETK